MAAKAQHYSIVVVDIERFGGRTDPVQAYLREQMYEVGHAALAVLGVDPAALATPADRGDGFFWLLPGDVDKVELTGTFIDTLHAGLRAHAAVAGPDGALRLRVALHYGQVAWDGRGWIGTELNSACRLVDIQPLRAALAAADRATLALAVSDRWYEAVVRHDHPGIDRATFRRVAFDAKEVRDRHAWISVPGYSAPPGIAEFVALGSSASQDASTASAGASGRPGSPRDTGRAAPAEKHIARVGVLVEGDQINHGPLTINLGDGVD